jgi:hypothetical protein
MYHHKALPILNPNTNGIMTLSMEYYKYISEMNRAPATVSIGLSTALGRKSKLEKHSKYKGPTTDHRPAFQRPSPDN